MKKTSGFIVALIIFLIPVAGHADCGLKSDGHYLSQIEEYKAPPFPNDYPNINKESYDYRVASSVPNPPTLTDTFIADIWLHMSEKGMRGVPPNAVPTIYITQVLDVYDKRWDQISGLRPWTHKNYVNCLSSKQKNILVEEISTYLKKYGVRDPTDWIAPEGRK